MFLLILSGVVSGLAQHSIGFHFLILISLVPLVRVLVSSKTIKESILIGAIWGFSYVLTTIFWLAFNIGVPLLIGIISMIAAVLFLLFNYICIAILFYHFNTKITNTKIILLPIIWTSVEYLRSFFSLGFPWISLGNTQAYTHLVAQNAEFFGIYGISFWIVLVNCLINKYFNNRSNSILYLISLVIIVPFFTGKILENRVNFNLQNNLNISVVQPNVHLNDKRKNGFEHENILNLMEMSMSNITDSTDLVIWPETATISYLLQGNKNQLDFIQNKLKGTQASILTGLPFYENDRNYFYNSIAHINSDTIFNVYHKINLVPIAEYVPLSSTFESLKKINIGQANFSKGEEQILFNINGYLVAGMVCFESTFPQLNRKFVNNGAEALIYVINDGWYETNPEPMQHAKQAIFRAIEFRRPVIRCANTGISQVIDSKGNIQQEIKLNNAGVINASIMPSNELTFYAKYGDVFSILNILALVIMFIRNKIKS